MVGPTKCATITFSTVNPQGSTPPFYVNIGVYNQNLGSQSGNYVATIDITPGSATQVTQIMLPNGVANNGQTYWYLLPQFGSGFHNTNNANLNGSTATFTNSDGSSITITTAEGYTDPSHPEN